MQVANKPAIRILITFRFKSIAFWTFPVHKQLKYDNIWRLEYNTKQVTKSIMSVNLRQVFHQAIDPHKYNNNYAIFVTSEQSTA